MHRTSLPISSITIGDRERKDYGDLEELADSLEEYGLIQPIVVDQSNRLVAGGRRLEAAKLLNWENIDVVYKETLSDRHLKEMELEENLKRLDMSWQERACSIARIHKMKSTDAAIEGDGWSMRQTGALLNMPSAAIHNAVKVAQLIENDPQGPIATARNMFAAMQVIDQAKEKELVAELARRTIAPAAIKVGAVVVDGQPAKAIVTTENGEAPVVDLTTSLINADCLNFCRDLPESSIDCIITDPPYGIDLDMLEQQNPHGGMKNIDAVRDEHTVEGNEQLFKYMLPAFYRILKDRSFMVLWCDIMQWQLLYDLATSAGFKVQRWPLTWHKTHSCINQCAQYNFTKNTEIAMVCRKGNATLVKPASSSVIVASNDIEMKKLGHPFVKPGAVWEFIANHVSIQGETIFDPFAGVGSCPLSMLGIGRKVLACELVPDHYNLLVENVKQHFLSINPNTQFI